MNMETEKSDKNDNTWCILFGGTPCTDTDVKRSINVVSKRKLEDFAFVTPDDVDVTKGIDEAFVNQSKDNKFKCELCDKQFLHYKILTNHIKKKHGNKDGIKFSCDECGNVYAQKFNLEQHIKVKHQNFRYKCPDCPELEYSSRSTLDVHIKAKHRGQKYKCTECGIEYAYRHEYVHHMRSIHLGVRYNCELCGNEFRSKVSLKDHMISAHEKIKPFKCEVCHRVYARSSCLWVHRKRKHPETIDKCKQNRMSFGKKSEINDNFIDVKNCGDSQENDINDVQLTDLKMNPYVLLKRCDSLEIYLKHHMKDTC